MTFSTRLPSWETLLGDVEEDPEAKKLEDAKQQQQRDTAARREANLQSKGPSRELKALAEKPVTTPV